VINYQNFTLNDLLLPMPHNITMGSQTVYLNRMCKFNFMMNGNLVNGAHHNIDQNNFKDDYLIEKIVSTYDKIINKNTLNNFSFTRSFLTDSSCEIRIELNLKNNLIMKYSDDYTIEYESYAIKMDLLNLDKPEKPDLNIRVESLYLNGLIRALETLSQILFFNNHNFRYELYNLPLEIYDKPLYKYRGVMIDTSRQFISLNKIREVLDGMMFSKLNVLHWHLTDDEYFGFETNAYKSNTNDFVYSKEQIKNLIDYAFERGITIIPEIDNPSHTKSWKSLDPSIVISKPEYGTLDPSKNLTYKIVENIINETIELFSSGDNEYVHLGGDEVLSSMWEREDIKNFMKENNLKNISQLENFYFNKIRQILPKNKQYVYWITNQASEQFNVYDQSNSVLMYWGLFSSLEKHLNMFTNPEINRKLILTPGDYLYLDCGLGNKYGDDAWCGNYKTWKTVYNFPIFQNYKNFTVLGSQVVLFGELADENSIVGKIFPRACSLAERLWSLSKLDIKSFFVRLLNHNKRLRDRHISSISFTTLLCENEPNECLENIK
jgi:hexosaminidase